MPHRRCRKQGVGGKALRLRPAKLQSLQAVLEMQVSSISYCILRWSRSARSIYEHSVIVFPAAYSSLASVCLRVVPFNMVYSVTICRSTRDPIATTLTYRFYCFSYHGYHDVIHWSRCTVHNCRYSNIATCPIHSCRCHLLFETRYRFQGRHEMESFEGLCRDVIKKEVKKGHSKPAKKKRGPSASSAASSSSSSSSSRSSSRNSRNQGGGAGGHKRGKLQR